MAEPATLILVGTGLVTTSVALGNFRRVWRFVRSLPRQFQQQLAHFVAHS